MIVKEHISVEQCALHVSMEIFDSGETLVAFKKATYHNTISVTLHFLKLPHYSTVLLPASPLSKEK